MQLIRAAFIFLLLSSAAYAQDARVVSTCGTLPSAYAAGSTQLPTVDVNGKLCLNSSGGGGTPADPTATAGPAAVNGSAATYMRSDAAPAVQVGSSTQEGLLQCGSNTTCTAGTISVAAPGSPGGSNTQVQYNASSSFGGISGVTSNGTAMTFANSDLLLLGSSTGYTTFASANASGTNYTITFPAATGTVALTSGSVASFSAGTTGFTPNSATSGAVTLAGTLGVANGGTNCSTASITCFNNITGLSAAGTTGTTSTNLVFSTSPTLVTPTLGVATATSLNGNTFTTGTYTLTGSAGKTLDFTNTLILSGTDSTTMTFPSSSATVAGLGIAETWTAAQTFNTSDLVINGGSATAGVASVTSGGVVSSETIATALGNRTTLPTKQAFTSSSGTYTTPANVLWIEITLVGGGGGGGAGNSGTAGTTGGATCWNTSGAACSTPVYSAGGGTAGSDGGGGTAGGTISGTSACDWQVVGGAGMAITASVATTLNGTGAAGGNSSLGGAGSGGYAGTGSAASTNSGGGGGGGGETAASGALTGAGGGAGATCHVIINSPASTYTYAVGAGGAGSASPGTGGSNGGAGAAGQIIVYEHYGS